MLTLQLAAPEVLQNLLPIRRIIISTQIRLQLSRQHLQRRALSNTVRSNQSQYLPGPWHRQAVQLEGVGRVTMGDLRLEVGRQVDDVDGVEGTFLGADTAADAQPLANKGDFAGGVDLDAQLSRSNLYMISTPSEIIPQDHVIRHTTGHDFLHSCLHFFGLHLLDVLAGSMVDRG